MLQSWSQSSLPRMTASLRSSARPKAGRVALFLLAALLCPGTHAGVQDKDKKPEKEKKEKIEPWVEVRSAHFIVASDGGEKTARRFASQFEDLLRVFQATMPNSRVTTGIPVRILAAREGQSFARVVPEFPFDKRHPQPAGIFLSGPEKTYIALRANAEGHFPFEEIFRKYTHEVLQLSYRDLPPWLQEGYSNVYGNLSFNDRGVRLDRPDPNDLSILFESPLLPLDLVFHVDRDSGYYNSGSKDTVYFAESRVLVNFLIGDPQSSATKSLDGYITAVGGGADSLQAARRAFGDLNQLQARLESYIKQLNGAPVEISLPGGGDSGGPARTLSAAESEARIADFLALRGRNEDAEDKLEEALMMEPSLAEAEQSLGFLFLKRNELEDAQKHFERAAQLDPKDALNFYGEGQIAVIRGGHVGVPVDALASFEKTVALNPDFAPAWFNLAMIYSQRNETLQKALADAQQAARLRPGDADYQLQLAALLDRAGHGEEARKTAAHVEESASDRTTANKAGDLLARMSPPPPATASTANAPVKPSDSSLRIERKTEPEDKPSATASVSATAPATPKAAPTPAPPVPNAQPAPTSAPPLVAVPPPLLTVAHPYSMVGTITEVNCMGAPQIRITLKSQTIIMHLHADNLANVSIKFAGSDAAAKGVTCSSLRGRNARVSYLLVSEKPWDGEMQTMEFRSQP